MEFIHFLSFNRKKNTSRPAEDSRQRIIKDWIAVILNCAIVECGQRPPVLIDTSRPAEDSRQRKKKVWIAEHL